MIYVTKHTHTQSANAKTYINTSENKPQAA